MKGQRILRAGRPAYVRKESQGVLVIRATANKSLTAVLNGELCCAHCSNVLPVTQAAYFYLCICSVFNDAFQEPSLHVVVTDGRMVTE